MRTRLTGLLAGIGLFLTAGSPSAAGGWSDSPLGKAKFGDVWNGQSFSSEELSGRVVLIKSWADG